MQTESKEVKTMDILRFKKMWESRNPQHENNSNTGLDMFWETAELVAREYVAILSSLPVEQTVDAAQLFDKNTDCYADTWVHERGIMEEGEIILAITKEKFIELYNQRTPDAK